MIAPSRSTSTDLSFVLIDCFKAPVMFISWFLLGISEANSIEIQQEEQSFIIIKNGQSICYSNCYYLIDFRIDSSAT